MEGSEFRLVLKFVRRGGKEGKRIRFLEGVFVVVG